MSVVTPNSGGNHTTYGLKIGFPPGFPMKHKLMRFPDYTISVREAINYIASKQTIPQPENYVMQISYLAPDTPSPIVSITPGGQTPNSHTPQTVSPMVSRSTSSNSSVVGNQLNNTSTGSLSASGSGAVTPNPNIVIIGGVKHERKVKWMEENIKLSAYPLSSPDAILELKKKYQCVKVVERGVAQTLATDVTKPLSELMAFIHCKFKLDPSGDYRLFHSNNEIQINKDIKALNIDTNIPFFVKDKNDPNTFNQIDDPSLYEDGDSDDEGDSNLSLEVPVKTLTNIMKEGYLKKQNRKKSWNTRYFILTDKYLYYYKTPHDRKASGIINYKEHVIRVSGNPKDAKLELIPKEAMSIASASVHTHPGSFLIKFDNEAEMASWNKSPFSFDQPALPNQGKSRSGTAHQKVAVFGVPVERSVAPGSDVPLVVTQCMEYIEKKAMDVVGIFRLSGSVLTIEQWKKKYDKGDTCNLFEETDPHAISGLLKLYLRELPEPLLTYERYDKFIAAQSMDDLSSRLKLIKHLVKSLPPTNLAVLTKLMSFLGRVSQHSANNKMQIHNLSTVFGPNLLKERNSTNINNVQNLVEDTPIINALALSLIRDFPYIFGDKEIPEQKIMAKTLYDYNGGQEQDVTPDLIFPQGVTIRVTRKGLDGWWLGEYQGKTGRFPATYVELLPVSPASLLRTKSNSNLSKKKKFMLEMENAKEKTIENEKLLTQLQERRDKLANSITSLNQERDLLMSTKEVQRVLSLIRTMKSTKSTVAAIPKTIDTLIARSEDYRKSHEELANVKTTLLAEYDTFVINNPKVKAKLDTKEREQLQAKVDVLVAKLDDSVKIRQKSLSSKRNINEGLSDIKCSLVL